ncbi:AAA family ATPase [Tyzzerella sp. OttesenSCG-928-J15]|nr:AAA family ATPase [Tyzzerella sp. OttesenSCG-928-J15]
MMSIKMPAPIKKITLNAATFCDISIEPTLINFFYGNNGTGKSTISREIYSDSGIEWQQGKSADDYEVLVYNKDFIDVNFVDYGELKGVFTVGEQNIKTQAEIAKKNAQRAEQDKLNGENTSAKGKKDAQRTVLLNDFQKICWEKTKTIRAEYPETQKGYKTPISKFVDYVLQLGNPVQHDIGGLRALYETAFDPNATTYPEFRPTGETEKLKGSPGNKLLGKPITSSGDSPFADFIKAINATDWVRQGRERFPELPESKCPYCQQKLPVDFDAQIAACFDGQYQEDIDALLQFQEDYSSDMQGFIDILNANLHNAFPKLDLTEYKAKLVLLEKTIESNNLLIASKIKEPSLIITLDNVKVIRDELNTLIADFNKQICDNNTIVNAKMKKQAECTAKVWELIAFTLQNEVSAYKSKRKALDIEISEYIRLIDSGEKASRALMAEIAELNKDIVSTLPTMTNINELLRNSGFQGFILREKRGHQNVYEVVRQDGQVAENLSEGERNFIAFLYFYYLVRGSHTDSDISKDKVIVIDDPVSSMDSSVLFIVSTLVREMVGVCFNNAEYREHEKEVVGDYIKQIFVLTHNVYFHKEITYNQTSRYHCVSFYTVNKASNNSSIRHCVRPSLTRPTEHENFNPVQNSYTALWGEYKEVDTPIPTMNVIRRILEYYFMQLCGYDGVNIRKKVIEENKAKFIMPVESGQPDYTKYHLASAMLSYISANSVGFNDGCVCQRKSTAEGPIKVQQ